MTPRLQSPSALQAVGAVAPSIAARIAYRMLLQPPRAVAPPASAWWPPDARRVVVGSGKAEANVFVAGQGPQVLLLHGWGGRCDHMGQVARALIQAGCSVAIVEAPAHGDSRATQADMFDFANVIRAACAALGPIHGMVAHSLGGVSALIALDGLGLQLQRLVLLAVPASAYWLVDHFGEKLHIAPNVRRRVRRLLEQRHEDRWLWSRLSLRRMLVATRCPVLLVHDQDDPRVPFAHCQQLAGATVLAQVFATRNRGHLGVLSDMEVARRVAEFVAPSSLALGERSGRAEGAPMRIAS